jgi:hypothetical protein
MFCSVNLIHAKKVAVLDEITNPDIIFVDDHQLYIPQGTSIYIYSLKDYKLVKKFGKSGEGPQEFKINQAGGIPLIVDAQTENLVITSIGKVSYFTKKGKFIKEEKLPGGAMGGALIQPMGNHYFYLGFGREEKTVFAAVKMADLQFKEPKELLRVKHFYQPGGKFKPMGQILNFQTDTKCKHIVIDSTDGNLHIFGPDGKKKLTFTPDLKPVKLTDKVKEDIINYFKTEPRLKAMWQSLKNNTQFDSHFRTIQFTNIADCKIYAFTFEKKDGDTLLLVFDKNGKLLKKTYLPVVYRSPLMAFPIAFKNDTFYQVVANDEDDTWELHVEPLK